MSVLDFLLAKLAEMDLRYQQRFDASTLALNAALTAAEKAVQTALAAAREAVAKAESAAEKRFDSVNEFRAAYQDIISRQMPRAEAEQALQQLRDAIAELKSSDSTRSAHTAGGRDLWGFLVGAAGAVTAIVALLTR